MDINVIPIGFLYVEGKYVAVNCDYYKCNALGIPEGSILTRVNSTDVDLYVKSSIKERDLKYDFQRKKLKVNELIFMDKKNFEICFTVITPEGNILDKKVKSIIFDTSSTNNETSKKSSHITTRILVDNKIAYMKVKSMLRDFDSSDTKLKVRDFYNQVKDFPYLIIDIRGNVGGNTDYWEDIIAKPLIKDKIEYYYYWLFRDGDYIKSFVEEKNLSNIKTIINLPSSSNYPKEIESGYRYVKHNDVLYSKNYCGFNGKIYLLVDDYVYSASEEFAAFSQNTKFAKLIGTTTGGDGIGFAPIVASMPNSGIVFQFSAIMGLNPDGTANEETHTAPDIYCELTYDDFIKILEYNKDDKNDKIICPYDTILNKAIELCK